MDDLTERIVANSDIDRSTPKRTIDLVARFPRRERPLDAGGPLVERAYAPASGRKWRSLAVAAPSNATALEYTRIRFRGDDAIPGRFV
jgi:hypothetical protein